MSASATSFISLSSPRVICPPHINPAATWYDGTLSCFVVLENPSNGDGSSSNSNSNSPLTRRYRTLSLKTTDSMVQAAHNASPTRVGHGGVQPLLASRPVEIKLTSSGAPPPSWRGSAWTTTCWRCRLRPLWCTFIA